ncbi:hypothetical protein TNCV_285721 [Trichonephila clavipes]|nr:hypothetical protein TNCV_285721 [Trichonephila clavipes]
MHACTPKYCGVLSSDIASATYDRSKNQRLDTCESETPSVFRGDRKTPSQDYGVERDSVENTEENGYVTLPVDACVMMTAKGAGNVATSELTREMGNQRADSRSGGRRSGAEKKEQREQWPSRNPPPVVHKRDA